MPYKCQSNACGKVALHLVISNLIAGLKSSQNLDPNLHRKADLHGNFPGSAAAEREKAIFEAKSAAAKLHKQANEFHAQANYIQAAKLYKEVRDKQK